MPSHLPKSAPAGRQTAEQTDFLTVVVGLQPKEIEGGSILSVMISKLEEPGRLTGAQLAPGIMRAALILLHEGGVPKEAADELKIHYYIAQTNQAGSLGIVAVNKKETDQLAGNVGRRARLSDLLPGSDQPIGAQENLTVKEPGTEAGGVQNGDLSALMPLPHGAVIAASRRVVALKADKESDHIPQVVDRVDEDAPNPLTNNQGQASEPVEEAVRWVPGKKGAGGGSARSRGHW
ncbi:MAG: hypothetical protein ACSHX4_04075 [Opitutaceae bacterium]